MKRRSACTENTEDYSEYYYRQAEEAANAWGDSFDPSDYSYPDYDYSASSAFENCEEDW